jgi:hypothetical protein
LSLPGIVAAPLFSMNEAFIEIDARDLLQFRQSGFRAGCWLNCKKQIGARTFATSAVACLSAMIVALEPVTQPRPR